MVGQWNIDLLPEEGELVLQRVGRHVLLVGEDLHLLVHLPNFVLQRLYSVYRKEY